MTLTNAEKQRRFRKQRQQKEQEQEKNLTDLAAKLDQAEADKAELSRQISALAAIIADLKGQQ
jgi:predicted  nucleic acid-binding Zn-ribbon protein